MTSRLIPVSFTACTLLLASACSRAPAHDESPDPAVKGERIVFPANSPQRAAVSVAAAEPHGTEIHHLSGRVVWDEDATVRIYAPVAGRVVSIAAALGDRVEAGASLVRLASPDFGQAQADARKANADLLLAQRTFARTKDLFEHGAVARKDLEAAEDAHAAAEAEQQRAAARLKLYGAADGEVDGLFTLRSPIAGTLVEKNINPGQEVRPDQQLANASPLFAPLCVVSDPTHLRVLIDSPERELAALHSGISITIRSAAVADRTFTGQIDGVSDALDPMTHMVTVRGRVENPDRLLKAEMFVTVEFFTNGTPGVDVPVKAVFIKGDRHFVYLEESPGAYVRREIEIGADHDGKILVRSGVTAGQRVVTEGALMLEEVRTNPGGGE
jgi:cobalt-zinc-cadmium efflux system membrane fusion protein